MIPAIFQYDFMLRAFFVGTIIGVIAPIIGLFLIVRRYSLFADTISHVSLLGIAIGLLANTQPIITAGVVAVVGAIGIQRLEERTKIYGESVLALFLSGSLALATVLISLSGGFNVSLLNFLFGSISTVEADDLYFIAGLGVITIATIYLLYKELFFVSYDEEAAKVSGLNVQALGLVMIILAAITVSLSIRIVGVLLIGALMVVPGITAMQFRQSFRTTMIYAVILSLLSVILGLFLSFYVGLASGGSIVLIAMIFFVLSILFKENRQR
jgi:zinc transport system permease protein